MFIYTHTEIVPGFIAISAMLSSQYIIISGLIRDLQLTVEHHIQRHADMLMSRLLLHQIIMVEILVPMKGLQKELAQDLEELNEANTVRS